MPQFVRSGVNLWSGFLKPQKYFGSKKASKAQAPGARQQIMGQARPFGSSPSPFRIALHFGVNCHAGRKRR